MRETGVSMKASTDVPKSNRVRVPGSQYQDNSPGPSASLPETSVGISTPPCGTEIRNG